MQDHVLLEEYSALWSTGDGAPDVFEFLRRHADASPRAKLDVVMFDQGRRWRGGSRLSVEQYCARITDIDSRPLKLELIVEEYGYLLDRREEPDPNTFLARFPDMDGELLRRRMSALKSLGADSGSDVGSDRAMGNASSGGSERTAEPTRRGDSGRTGDRVRWPDRIGRYRVTDILGKGDFGCVYKAYDEQLRRAVAIKVPHPHRVGRGEDVEGYLSEARVLAGLDHPGIVPVHDVGRTDDGRCFLVSKFVEGRDLAAHMNDGRLPAIRSATLVADVAEALNFAHDGGLVHRDIKPANLLLDDDDRIYVADFGLALTEEAYGSGSQLVGSPAYMSPEQARRESHLVDRRSDVFSLGIVLYELLTGQRPFEGVNSAEVIRSVARAEFPPPRRHDPGIPPELERICLKAMAKRAADRYPTALAFAEDLRHYLDDANSPSGERDRYEGRGERRDLHAPDVVPQGLRAFDADDSRFFLRLLPGPRNRDGLPESLRFWRDWIEPPDDHPVVSGESDDWRRIGLIYGPSGCGKSSLVKAGLLPRLSDRVLAVYVEATGRDSELRLLRTLRRKCPALPENLGLAESIARLRAPETLAAGRKVLIVLDQFEQWLHEKRSSADRGALIDALRQCDGTHAQCIVMVRDDFWLAVSRFADELEIELAPGRNTALVDLFDVAHARRVLAEFGRGHGCLNRDANDLTPEQDRFLREAIDGLATDGSVVPIRVALLAEMLKRKPWTSETLREMGGADGVGVKFLEETFCSPSAHPNHRRHEAAARAVLKRLLPEPGRDIKGQMQSHDDLQSCSGYGNDRRRFDRLLRILDTDLRLVTPTSPIDSTDDGDRAAEPGDAAVRGNSSDHDRTRRYYQLTHDYLVPSLREWLTRKQRESRRGRAELLLAERSSMWNARRENRHLPSLTEYLQIAARTRSSGRSTDEARMMRAAGKWFSLRALLLASLLALGGWGLWEAYGSLRAGHLLAEVQTADATEVNDVVRRMGPYRRWLDPRLDRTRVRLEEESSGSPGTRDDEELQRRILHLSLARLPTDPGQVEYLCRRLLDAHPARIELISEALATHRQAASRRLWPVVRDPKQAGGRRLRAACGLARMDDASDRRWSAESTALVDQLVAVRPAYLSYWREALEPLSDSLLSALRQACRDERLSAVQRNVAADVLADYAQDSPGELARAIVDADDEQFRLFMPLARRHADVVASELESFLERTGSGDQPDAERSDAELSGAERSAKRRSAAAAALLCLNRTSVAWSLLRRSTDPRARSCLIHRVRPAGVDPRLIALQLPAESDTFVKQGLVLCLGEFEPRRLEPDIRRPLLESLIRDYRSHPDSGIHGAVTWLLRRWKSEDVLIRMELDTETEPIPETVTADVEDRPSDIDGSGQWFKNSRGQTFVLLDPGTFPMGSPPSEPERDEDESLEVRVIEYPFALGAEQVTRGQFERFRRQLPDGTRRVRDEEIRKYADPSDPDSSPALAIDWYAATAYCNWLSEQEDIPPDQWCYQPNADGAYGPGMRVAPNHRALHGYRLPGEAEWEYACRAGTTTARYHGQTDELLSRYARYDVKSTDYHSRAVGTLKPNGWGFSDMLGNAWDWCHDAYRPEAADRDEIETEVVDERRGRVLRGGAFFNQARAARCAERMAVQPNNLSYGYGFRVARTLPLRDRRHVIPAGSDWRYRDDGQDLGTAWRDTDHDDSTWKSGEAPLGYGDRPETVIGFGQDENEKHPTVYFRRTVELESIEESRALMLELACDDGAAVYVNGQEVCRFNLPDDAGFDDLAIERVDSADEHRYRRFPIPSHCLRPGGNVVAVEVHQVRRFSSDLRFDLQLLSYRPYRR